MGLLAQRRAVVSTGAIGSEVQTNPLPVGRYWFTAYGNPWYPVGPPPFEWGDAGKWFMDQTQTGAYQFSLWLGANAANIQIETIEDHDPLGPGGKPSLFVIFNVLSPIEWTLSEYGYPRTADDSIHSAEDLAREKLAESGDLLGGFIPSWVPWVAGGAVLVFGLYSVTRLVRG